MKNHKILILLDDKSRQLLYDNSDNYLGLILRKLMNIRHNEKIKAVGRAFITALDAKDVTRNVVESELHSELGDASFNRSRDPTLSQPPSFAYDSDDDNKL